MTVPFVCAIVGFADNYWILGTSFNEVKKLRIPCLEILTKHGWHTLVKDLTLCSTMDDSLMEECIIGNEILLESSRKVGFKALGTQITFD